MDAFNYLLEIQKSDKYDIALMTTFNFEIGFFENCIRNSLANSGIKKVSVYVDAKQLSVALENVDSSSMGRKYMVSPVRMDGAFHPKLILLLGEVGAKLFISSANLTTSGFCINNEIVNMFQYDEEHPENLKIIGQAIRFFEKLEDLSFKKETALFDEIKNLSYYGRTNRNDDAYLLNNLDIPILEQVRKIVREPKFIDIAVPYYDNDLGVLNRLREMYPSADMLLHVQNGKSKFPTSKVNETNLNILPFLNVASDKNEKGNNRFYHGKVFRFVTENNSYVLYGSANCTQSAMTKAYSEGGNIECDILEQGEPHEFDSFFEGFVPDAGPLVCEELVIDSIVKTNIWFKYGEANRSSIVLFFGFSHLPVIHKVMIGDLEVKYSLTNNEVRIEIPMDEFNVNSEIFTVDFFAEDGWKKIKCWVIYNDCLSVYRMAKESTPLANFKPGINSGKYNADVMTLMNAMKLSVADLENEAAIARAVNPPDFEEPETEDGDDEDGLVDFIPPSVDEKKQFAFNQRVEEITWSYRRVFQSASSLFSNKKNEKDHTSNGEPELRNHNSTATRDEDELFVRFVKTNSRKMLNEEYVKHVDPDRYLNYTLVFFETLDKYSIYYKNETIRKIGKVGINLLTCLIEKDFPKEEEEFRTLLFWTVLIKEEDELFSVDYIVNTKAKFLLNLSKMPLSEEAYEVFCELVFLTIIMNHIVNRTSQDRAIDNINKKMLLSLRQGEELRDIGFLRYSSMEIDRLRENSVDVIGDEIDYIDRLFGYKRKKQLEESLRADFKENAQISMEDNVIRVDTKVEAIGDYFDLCKGSLRDINNFVKVLGGYTSFVVNIEAKERPERKNGAERITFTSSVLPSNGMRRTIYYKSGKTESETISIFN